MLLIPEVPLAPPVEEQPARQVVVVRHVVVQHVVVQQEIQLVQQPAQLVAALPVRQVAVAQLVQQKAQLVAQLVQQVVQPAAVQPEAQPAGALAEAVQLVEGQPS